MEKKQTTDQKTKVLLFKASLLLSVGRVDQAQKTIDRTLLSDANDSHAYALKSIIAVTKNRRQKALTLAKKAVSLDLQSSAAKIALSYAYQSKFDLDSALSVTNDAVKLSPKNALAWARLAELQLSHGERKAALKSANKAQQLNPRLARTQAILGFANLAQVEIKQAKIAFTDAINLNSADPLARLGLGLTKIRQGDIEEGTQDLETAVSLDPENAIMRSYLGKAYYELKNDGYAATELAIAKQMDSKDPTSWFYDAIRKQTTNRLVEALRDMHKAIELNDNRAVYRSSLLLDEDLAARSASIGRIYNDLGFRQRGILEGWKSVDANPGNYSAHRLLADNYSTLPRHEIGRVSELLQSQLLQPSNITPVQPSLAESDLFILEGTGPSSPSFNEFNPLFTRNRFALHASGIYGGNDTIGDEVTHSGIWDNFSYSIGQFHFETDGFRQNNDLKEDIYNVFGQINMTANTSLQTELRSKNVERGDLFLNFDKDSFSKVFRQSDDIDTLRVGLRHNINPSSTIIANYGTQWADQLSEFRGFSKLKITDRGHTGEIQYLYDNSNLNLIIGGGSVAVDRKINNSSTFFPTFEIDQEINGSMKNQVGKSCKMI